MYRIPKRGVFWALVVTVFTIGYAPTVVRAQSLEDRVIEYRLDNGMLFLLVPMPNQAPVFSGVVMVKVGGVDEQIGQTGLAHMFEHMAFKGTPWIGTTDYDSERLLLEQIDSVAIIYTRLMASIPMDQREVLGALERRTLEAVRVDTSGDLDPASVVNSALAETLEVAGLRKYPHLDTYIRAKELSAELAELNEEHREFGIKDEFSQIVMVNGGVGFNAGTGKDYTIYYESFPANRLELWMLLESQRFMYPVMREFYSERDVVIEERRMRSDDDPDGKLYENFMASAMIAHPYARPIIGWRSDIEQATAQEALEFRNRYYVPENSVGVLVGNFDVDEAKQLVTQYFGRIPAAVEPVPEIRTVEPPQAGERRIDVEFDAEPQVMIGFHKPNYPNPEGYAFRVIANILRDVGNSSRFYQELVKTGIASDVWVYEEIPGQRYPNVFLIQASPIAPHTTADVEREIYRILDDLAVNGPTELELRKAKNQIQARYVRGLTDMEDLAQSLAHAQLISGNWRVLVEHTDVIEQVTAEDVRQAAETYFRAKNRTVGTLVRPNGIE